ncbi:MOSC domain-containing protein [Sphingomonas morindae]|uniref:MOSC domain-containing protein n=1 Tax=Sphingomonas morindae TaxID=1541170 RepID=A0ABY4XBH9_9SPHN|nr:MOSC domain-containing protein [Sphingomonas morindae]USI74311.1 MOSC domain-containing protein [Sphingomonas morindae]
MSWALSALLVGAVRPLGGDGQTSAIDKRPVERPLWLSAAGLEGDAQADGRHHGGADKALHHYPLDHYAAWRDEIGDRPALAGAGGFGENLATRGLVETDMALGDRFRLGGALIEVSQARQPCWKLNRRFAQPDMARRVQACGRTGWYYRVLEPGLVAPEDRLERVDRRDPDWTIARLVRLLYITPHDRDTLRALQAVPDLPAPWHRLIAYRLETGRVEDWTARLLGPDAEPG